MPGPLRCGRGERVVRPHHAPALAQRAHFAYRDGSPAGIAVPTCLRVSEFSEFRRRPPCAASRP
ncbi:hypothetical protein C7S16_4359 [Burkholderia thailandensis]|uniref:Uncharacterized protein n=1 Tax=Burkholderia thailandensis TaxID=57975 RepID=A0AAW9CRT9_BURTH|nr:hypothetical protein [Burkholderia thailandensis]MDW9252561.1 hypothetical protein [Burkholderia thailandensis]